MSVIEFLRSDILLVVLLTICILLFVLYIINVANLRKLRKSYLTFMKKLGSGQDFDEMLRGYINRVEQVEKKNSEIISYCKVIDENIKRCSQKVGLVRYNAFKDTGSDLSFALAVLDDFNNGVVLNGIYARDCSNIYAKPIENGESKYVLSNEEKEAIYKAINNVK